MTQSLKTCLNFHDNPHSAALIGTVIATTIQLIQLTTHRNSAERFAQLCELLGEGIIGRVWVYASRCPDVIEATLEFLPIVVKALDIGTSRYLKVL